MLYLAHANMTDTVPNFERLTVVQLRESCQRRGLETGGLKKELISRLNEHEGSATFPSIMVTYMMLRIQ